MLLLLVRHAQAGERDAERWPDDSVRPLTNPGRAAHARVSRALRRLDCTPDLIVASPWVRALQTAEIMADEMGVDAEIAECEPLTIEPNLQTIANCLPELEADATVALVGHSPYLEDLASLLLSGAPGRLAVDLPKSGVMAIETERMEAGVGTLRFLLRPKQLERLRRRRK